MNIIIVLFHDIDGCIELNEIGCRAGVGRISCDYTSIRSDPIDARDTSLAFFPSSLAPYLSKTKRYRVLDSTSEHYTHLKTKSIRCEQPYPNSRQGSADKNTKPRYLPSHPPPDKNRTDLVTRLEFLQETKGLGLGKSVWRSSETNSRQRHLSRKTKKQDEINNLRIAKMESHLGGKDHSLRYPILGDSATRARRGHEGSLKTLILVPNIQQSLL